jgi:hypothetical protein
VARLVGVCAVLLVLVLAIVPAMGAVTSQSSTALTVAVNVPDKVKINDFNHVTITLKNTASYPISARVVIKPSYFILRPEWFEGVNATKDGPGVTFTLFNIPAGSEKKIRVTIPGNVLKDLKGDIRLFREVVVYPFTSVSATEYGVEAKNLHVLSVNCPVSKAEIDTALASVKTVSLLFLGGAFFAFATKGEKTAIYMMLASFAMLVVAETLSGIF